MIETGQKIRECPVYLNEAIFTVTIEGQAFTAPTFKALSRKVDEFYKSPPIEAMIIPWSTGQMPRKVKYVCKGNNRFYEVLENGKLCQLDSFRIYVFDQAIFDSLMELYKQARNIEQEWVNLVQSTKKVSSKW